MIKAVSIAIAAIVALFGLSFAFGSFYTVDEGYRGVITRNGAVVGEAGPGLGWKTPFITSVTEMSVKTEKQEFRMPVYSRDIQQADVVMSVNFRLDPSAVLPIYSTVGTDFGNKVIFPVVFDRTKNVMGQYTAADIIAKREAVGSAIFASIGEPLLKRGLVIESVQIENIDFSDAYEAAAEGAAKAQADVQRMKQELEQVRVSAQQQVATAEAKAQATKATADAEAYATKAKGEAEAEAIAARGKALRENPQLVDLITAEKWTGTLPSTMVPGSSVPFVNVK